MSESNDIDLEIVAPNQILFPTRVYPIPQNRLGVNSPIKLNVRIVKNTPNYLYLNRFQPFIPELLTSEGQIIQGHLVAEEFVSHTQSNRPFERHQRREFEWWKIRPEVSTSFSLTAKLFWHNNFLQLKIPTIPDYVLGSVSPNYFWYFDALEAKPYQLRFILNSDRETTLLSGESNIRQERTAPRTSSEMLATQGLNLRLVQPLSTDSHAVEVNGVLFKIEMPESILHIPTMQWTIPFMFPRAKTDVKLGIHVTNNTSTALRFYQAHSIDVILIGEDGKEINWVSEMIRPGLGKEPQYYSVQPGKNAFFDLNAMLLWNKGQIEFAITNKARGLGDCGCYYFPDLKPSASYQLQVIYRVSERTRRLEEQVLEKVWTGWIAMPFVEFCLVKS